MIFATFLNFRYFISKNRRFAGAAQIFWHNLYKYEKIIENIHIIGGAFLRFHGRLRQTDSSAGTSQTAASVSSDSAKAPVKKGEAKGLDKAAKAEKKAAKAEKKAAKKALKADKKPRKQKEASEKSGA